MMEVEIDNLKFDHNPVNLDLQKSKANLARHLRNRRPPTRSKMPRINHEDTVFTHLPIMHDFHKVNQENKDKMNNDTAHLDSEKADDKENSHPWIRSSPARRSYSYQYPATSRFKIRMDKSTELVPGIKSDLESVLGKVLRRRADFESWSKTPSSVELRKSTPILRKKSFVTEATLQETKRKLRHVVTNVKTPAVLRSGFKEIDNGVFKESKCYPDKENEKTNISKDLEITEAKDDCVIHSSKGEEIKPCSENEVPVLLKKFEEFDKPRTSDAAIVEFIETQDVIQKGKVFEAIKNFEKNGITLKTPESTSLTKSGSYFFEKSSQLVIEPDFLAKRHSIACDDTKYVASTFKILEPSFSEKVPLAGKSTAVNVNNFESNSISLPSSDTDAKKPKTVEFTGTEVHFAATEPGKIRIVETSEKPQLIDLYRKKKRSVSVSPPQNEIDVIENSTNSENLPHRRASWSAIENSIISDETSEKCHFEHLKNDEDEFKIMANMTEFKQPKNVPEETMKLNDYTPETENSSTNLKKSSILLNESPRIEAVFNDAVKKPQTSRHLGITNANSQDIERIGKVPGNDNQKKAYLVRKDSDRESMKHEEKISSKDSIVNHGSIRRSTKSVNIKKKLPDSGRDGWLNLPKEPKVLSEKKPTEYGKHEIYRKPHIDHVKKDRRTRSGVNGCGDISSEEDSIKKSNKVYIPLSAIHEKSKITKSKNASNSSAENQSSSFKFKNPVLKTEERSHNRAARVSQRASSREMLMGSNVASLSDEITSENEWHHSRISKPHSIRKSRSSPKTVKSVSMTSNLLPKKTVTSSAKTQIDIFNVKDKMNNEIRSTRAHNTSSKSSNWISDVKSSRCKPQTSQQKSYTNVPEKNRTKSVLCSNRDTKNLPTLTAKSTRPIR